MNHVILNKFQIIKTYVFSRAGEFFKKFLVKKVSIMNHLS